jgi:hypothetical protein
MKLSKFAFLATSLLATSMASQAAVTMTFSAVTGLTNGVLTNLAGSDGSVNLPRVWGILVDTAGNGFKLGEYLPGASMAASSSSVLSVTSGPTDDVLYLPPLLMINSDKPNIDGGTVATGNLARPNHFASVGTPNGSVGQAFYIVWFDATAFGGEVLPGDRYGAFRIPAFTIPGDGYLVSYAPDFVGVEPVRLADMSFIPETSTALLGALGALGLLRRRR